MTLFFKKNLLNRSINFNKAGIFLTPNVNRFIENFIKEIKTLKERKFQKDFFNSDQSLAREFIRPHFIPKFFRGFLKESHEVSKSTAYMKNLERLFIFPKWEKKKFERVQFMKVKK